MSVQDPSSIRYVILHHPGPDWLLGIDFREQPGVMGHVDHYQELFEQGKLELGGPFLTKDKGGMMVPVAGLERDELQAFAAADPAVESGLLTFEIQPWYVAMQLGPHGDENDRG